mmetsp:Transcript_2705/g.3100  ORF Transcript_2705/g.3100 Transcript_2705/m.3100 type:complete len:92 (-) Transcript_2705:36-311(-)
MRNYQKGSVLRYNFKLHLYHIQYGDELIDRLKMWNNISMCFNHYIAVGLFISSESILVRVNFGLVAVFFFDKTYFFHLLDSITVVLQMIFL